MSVRGLAIYSAIGFKKFAGIRSGPGDVSDRKSFSSRKTSWNVTGIFHRFRIYNIAFKY